MIYFLLLLIGRLSFFYFGKRVLFATRFQFEEGDTMLAYYETSDQTRPHSRVGVALAPGKLWRV